jgi:hypothetical protein
MTNLLKNCFYLFFLLPPLSGIAENPSDSGKRFVSHAYSLVFRVNGTVDIYDGREKYLGTAGQFDCSELGLQTESLARINTGPGLVSNKDIVEIEHVATARSDQKEPWPTVRVEYLLKKGQVTAVWEMMPEMVRVRYEITPPEGIAVRETKATAGFQMTETKEPIEQIKPARWLRHPHGGVPYQVTAGMADRYDIGGSRLIIANDQGFDQLISKGKIHIQIRDIPRPWLKNLLQGSLVFSFSRSPAALPLAVAAAGQATLMLSVESPQPFYLWDSPADSISVKAWTANLFHRSQQVDVRHTARDFDGKILADRSQSVTLDPLKPQAFEIKITPSSFGPIYLEVTARHNSATEFQWLSLGALPKREFLDGKGSRFGISGYAWDTGSHTEARTESQILELMNRIGTRWLLRCENRELAHRMGFFTLLHNQPYSVLDKYFRGQSTWANDSTKREAWLRGNLERAVQEKDSWFNFSNEWNLRDGEMKGVLAERYVNDWLRPLHQLRDRIAPQMKLTGCVVAGGDLVFLEKVYRAGGWELFDGLNFHASGVPKSPDYDDPNDYWTYLGTLRRIHEGIRKFGKKELWMTELYAPTAPNNSCSTNERQAAERIALMYGLAVAADVRCAMLWRLDDNERRERIYTAGEVGEPSEREYYFGLIRRDYTPKAGLWAYQTASYMFDGARFLGDIDMPADDLHGMLFEGREGRFAMLWSRREGYVTSGYSNPRYTHRPPWEDAWTVRTPIPVKAAGREVMVIDAIGRQRTLIPGPQGNVNIELTGAPVYVLGGEYKPVKGRLAVMFGWATEN